MLEPVASAPRRLRGARAPAPTIGRRCSPPGGCTAAAAHRRPPWSPPPAASRSRCSAAASPTSCCCPTAGASSRPAIGRGLSALPGARVPYRGLDEWTRIVLCLGGTMLAVLAALIAFWPRAPRARAAQRRARAADDALRRPGRRARPRRRSSSRGALLALLVVAYLRLERLRISDAGAAACLAVAVTILGLAAAPALDTDQPWFDYETWALSNASSKSTSFSWDHSYGPLDWPRDGRELLRVKAQRPAYWKATNLEQLRRQRWVRDRGSANLDGCDVSATCRGRRALAAADPRLGAQPAHADVRDRRRRVRDRLAAAVLRCRSATAPTRASAASCAAATPTARCVYTPAAERARAARGRRRRAPRRCSASPASSSRPPRRPTPTRRPRRTRSGTRRVPAVRRRPGRRWRRRSPSRGAEPVRGARPARAAAATRAPTRSRSGSGAGPATRRTTSRRCCATSAATTSPTPSRRRRRAENLDGFLFDAQVRLLPAVLRRDGAAAAHGRRARARLDRLHRRASLDRKARRVRRARPRRALVGRGLVPGHRLGDVRPDARPPRRRARSPTTDGGRRRRVRARGRPGPRRRHPHATPAAGVAATGQGPPWTLIGLGGAPRARRWPASRCGSCAGTGGALAAGWGPLAELERALRARAPRARARPRRSARSRRSFARTPAAAGYVRAAARAALRPARRSRRARRAPRAARRAGPRRRRSPGACAPGGRCRRDRADGRSTLGGEMDDVYDLFQRGTALLEAGDFNSATVPLSKARDLDPDKTSIREALGPRVLPLAAVREGRGPSSRRSSSAPRRTTSRCSASAAR